MSMTQGCLNCVYTNRDHTCNWLSAMSCSTCDWLSVLSCNTCDWLSVTSWKHFWILKTKACRTIRKLLQHKLAVVPEIAIDWSINEWTKVWLIAIAGLFMSLLAIVRDFWSGPSVAEGLRKLAWVTGPGFSLPFLSSRALPASKWPAHCKHSRESGMTGYKRVCPVSYSFLSLISHKRLLWTLTPWARYSDSVLESASPS